MIAIFAAMSSEVDPFLSLGTVLATADVGGCSVSTVSYDGFNGIVCQTGIGSCAATATAAVLDRYSPKAAVSVGIAGGISPELRAGYVLLCDRVCISEHGNDGMECESVESDTALLAAAARALDGLGLEVSTGSSLTVPEVISTPEHKQTLRKASSHDIVEMESYWIGKAASERDIPSLAVRVVSDQADDTLVLLGEIIRPGGTLDYDRLAEYVREHPEHMDSLGRNAERWRVSSAAMACVAEALIAPSVWASLGIDSRERSLP